MRRLHLAARHSCLVAVLLAGSCSRDPEPPILGRGSATAPGDPGPGNLPDAATLSPVFTISGAGTRIPDSVLVSLARPVNFAFDDEGRLAGGTSLVVEPPLTGQLEVVGASTLRFTPSQGFLPGTRYALRLASIEAQGGVIAAPAADAWRTEFATPAFRFDRATLTDFLPEDKEATVEVAFTGPVDAKQALGEMSFTSDLGERLAARLAWGDRSAREERRRAVQEPAPPPHVVLVRLSGDSLLPGRSVTLAIDSGVRLSGRRMTAGEASTKIPLVEFPLLPEAKIIAAHAAEGTNGFFVELVCTDGAVEETRWYWDPVSQEGYGQISQRCMLDERELAEKLRFEPPVPFTTAPAGAGVRLFGNFSRGSHVLRVDAGLRTADGGITRREFESTISIPARAPRLSFVSKGRYLPREQWRALPFRHLNVDTVDVVVRHVRAENLVFWASADGEHTSARDSDVLAKTRIAVSASPDELRTAWLDVASLVPASTRGLLEISMGAGEAADTSRLLLTDIQLVAKRDLGAKPSNQGGDVLAWAFDAESLRALGGVQVDLVRPSGQVVATGLTDSSGEVRLRVRTPGLEQERPFALVARKDKDVTYLAFDEVRNEVDDAHVGGESPDAEIAWRAALFTDRGVYRPGETAHLTALVRDANYGPAAADMPVLLRVVDPRGRALREAPLSVSASGFAVLSLALADFATTGRHEAQLEIAGKRVASRVFHVEEFVPERMKVEARPRTELALAGEPLIIDASARYLFGGVPSDHQAELTCVLEPVDFVPAQNSQYHYGPWRDEDAPGRDITLGTSTGVLDAEGRAELSCATSAAGLAGPGRVVASVAVFESGGGRTSVGQAAVTLHPERHVIGLSSRTAAGRGGEPIQVDGIVVDWEGRPSMAVTEVEVSLLRLEREWGWWYDEAEGRSSHRSYTRAVPEGSLKAKVSQGKFTAELRPGADASAFAVRAVAGGARTELRVPGSFDDGWWRGEGEQAADRTPRPGKPAWLPIEVPKTAAAGKRIKVSLVAPHRGRLLMTAEAESVLEREWMDVDAGPVEWSFRLGEFRPNVYVSALLLKPPHLESRESFLPDRAFGVASVRMEPAAHSLNVRLTAPEEIRSGPLTVTIDVGKLDQPGQAVIAVVDEGILSLTKFESPDPLIQVFSRRALGVETFETVGWTLQSAPPPPTGLGSGDALLGLGRVQAVKPVSLWSGLVDIPASGKAEVTFQVPTYRGQLRIMAVAATPKRMGSASRSVIVRDPLTLQVTLPRFLVHDDIAQVPVFVTNVSGARQEVEVTLVAEALDTGGAAAESTAPELIAVSGGKQRLALAEGESGTALFTLRVKGRTGAVRLLAQAVAGKLRSHDELDIPILTSGPRTRIVQRLELEQGSNDLTAALAGWEPLSERTTIRVTSNPYGDAFDHLKHLIRYPYGCIEQTVSSSRPLLAMRDLVPDVDPAILATGGIEDRLAKGIERTLSMQVASGAFSYWPGAGQEAWWGTAYATHFLLDAQQAGHPVPQDRLDAALAWMEDRITNHFERNRHHGDWYSENAEPYFHLVLARAGRARPARAEALLQAVPGETEGHRSENTYMLQAALYLSGDRRFEKQLRATDVSPVSGERSNGWSFYSDRRRRGFMLATRVDLFGADAEGEKLANLVAEALRAHPAPYYSTQELVWCLTGLAKFTGATAPFSVPGLVAGGRTLEPAPRPPGASTNSRTWDVVRASERGVVSVEVAEKGEGRLFAIVSSEGVRQGAVASAASAGLSVSRSFVDGAGIPLDAASEPAKLGDTLHVVLSVGNTTRERIANVALVDRIPAGWEIENPRLGRKSTIDWLPEDELWAVDHLDVRDDRLEAFGHLDPGETRKVAYSVRAVTTGRFAHPPASAEAMYDPSIHGSTAASHAEITGPWAPVAQ